MTQKTDELDLSRFLVPQGPPQGVPIGALPPTEEPPRWEMGDLFDELSGQLRVLRSGLQDVTQATGRLATLPLEAARWVAQRLRQTPV